MDTKRLNNEIILCRPAVRKARVAVIRKIVRNMKILKACKIEALKEKKLKKCERLFEKVQIMKKVKDDEVTKFALKIKNLESFLKQPKLNLKQIALAYLAKHEAVVQKVNFIRELIPNWETELPLLLKSLGKKKKKKLIKKPKIIKSNNETAKSKTVSSENENENDVVKKNVKEKVVAKKLTKQVDRNVSSIRIGSSGNMESKRTSSAERINDHAIEIEKVDDPFFVGKKVIASKLMLENLSSKKDNSEKVEKAWNKKELSNTSVFNTRPFRTKKNSYKFTPQKSETEPVEEELHPSWAAKKVKLIKPFEGTKIKFSDF